MCGFSAILSLGGDAPDAAVVERMGALIAHRGPDDAGVFRDHNLAFVFRRLSILDLAQSSHQPMLSADGRHVIVFNGEIYNYQELRAELASLGHLFRSTGDTEVLLAAFREWGTDCLQRLNGMWAFVIYDRTARRLFGSRDRFGEKPLFVYRDARSLVLASEIKAIRDSGIATLQPDKAALAEYLLDHQLDTQERTFYQGVARINAGSAFEIEADGRMRSWKYWLLDPAALLESAPQGDAVERFRELFFDSVRLRLRSDVPVGVQLSGGLDSTTILSTMASQLESAGRAANDLFAFCYMSPEFDETAQIAATVQQTGAQLVPLECSAEEIWDDVQRHLWYQDEPVHSFTSVVSYKLMALARSYGVKVILNGQGADEVLAGYPSYFVYHWLELLRRGQTREWRRAIEEYSVVHGGDPSELKCNSLRRWLQSLLASIPGYSFAANMRARQRAFSDAWVSSDLKSHWRCLDFKHSVSLHEALRDSIERYALPLYLRVEDRNSMAHGVEVRLPFLDHRLVQLAFQLGPQHKLRNGLTKVLLRDAAAGRIPEIVRTQPRKLGFPTSIDQWLRGRLAEPLLDLLSSAVVRESNLWNMQTVLNAAQRHRMGEINCGARLFQVAQVSLWLDGQRKGVPKSEIGLT